MGGGDANSPIGSFEVNAARGGGKRNPLHGICVKGGNDGRGSLPFVTVTTLRLVNKTYILSAEHGRHKWLWVRDAGASEIGARVWWGVNHFGR